jgi:uncharacterized protein Smg (DUF494 family)
MNEDNVNYLIETYMEQHYDPADADDLAALEIQVDSQQWHIRNLEKTVSNLIDRNNELVEAISTMAEAQGMDARVLL